MARWKGRKGRKRGGGDSNSRGPALNDTELFGEETDLAFQANDECLGVLVTGEEEKTFQLCYGIPGPIRQKLQALKNSKSIHWSHTWYRNDHGQPLKVTYAANLDDSEKLAKQFLDEKVLGFDMEWKPTFAKAHQHQGIKNNISLIQVASETQIGLFHIALHSGNSVEQLLAPSLRQLIETDTITKTGVSIHQADGKRLQQWMKLNPKGLFELSHLFNLVKCSRKNTKWVSRNLVAMSRQVEEHLGFPLHKGKVRTSNWAQALDGDQIRYAASDAYAGLMLFHVMEAKRLKLNPTPPRPFHAELGLPIRLADAPAEDSARDGEEQTEKQPEPCISPAHVQARTFKRIPAFEDLATCTLEDRAAFGEASSSTIKARKRKYSAEGNDRVSRAAKYKGWEILASDEQALLEALYENRTAIVERERSKGVFLRAFVVASNATLASLACLRPMDTTSLLKVPQIGRRKAELYGAEWLSIISAHAHGSPSFHSLPSGTAEQVVEDHASSARTPQRRRLLLLPNSPLVMSSSPPGPDFKNWLESSPLDSQQVHGARKDAQVILGRAELNLPSTPIFIPSTLTLPNNSQMADPAERRLLSSLAALRLRLSHLSSKKQEDVCPDTTLKLIATRQPTSRADVCRIPGAGKLMMVAKSHDIDLLSFLGKQASRRATYSSQAAAPLSSFPNQELVSGRPRKALTEAQIQLLMLAWVDRGIESVGAGMPLGSSGNNG